MMLITPLANSAPHTNAIVHSTYLRNSRPPLVISVAPALRRPPRQCSCVLPSVSASPGNREMGGVGGVSGGPDNERVSGRGSGHSLQLHELEQSEYWDMKRRQHQQA